MSEPLQHPPPADGDRPAADDQKEWHVSGLGAVPGMRIWFDPPALRWRWVLGVSVVASVAVVGLMRLAQRPPGNAEPVTPPAVAVAPAASAVAPPPAASAARSTTRRALAAAVPEAGGIAICGGPRVRPDATGAAEAAQVLAAMTRDVRERTLAAMQTSPGELAQAAALAVEAVVAEPRDQLARMAVATSDARVYALAFRACDRAERRHEGACQMLSVDQWVRLDPGNAALWLEAAAEAGQRHDAGGVGEALYRVARASRHDAGGTLLAATVFAHLPPGDDALWGSVGLLDEVLAATDAPDHSALSRYCSDDALKDVNRRQTCADIAELLVLRPGHLLDLKAGREIGVRVGWPAQRGAALLAQEEAMTRALVAWKPGAPKHDEVALGCDAAKRRLAQLRELAHRGEIGVARSALGRVDSPESAAR